MEPSEISSPAPTDDSPPQKLAPQRKPRGRPPRASRASVVPSEPSVVAQGEDETPQSTPRARPQIKQEPVDEDMIEDSQLPTPRPSASSPRQPKVPDTPSTLGRGSTPLADITQSIVNDNTVNEDTIVAEKQVPVKFAEEPEPMDMDVDVDTDKPAEIVVRKAAPIPPVPQQTGPKKRLVITWLVLTNFKSYAGVQKVGPFHASFSAVVGPNGSGKSNVIDSLLFVFGFRASKMRQGKISALIHHSFKFPDLPYCEVAVHFEEVLDLPGGRREVVPNSQLVVSRRAFRNNSSKYYINGRESTFTIVTTMLKEKDVDLDHKRFLILQGEVESIALMKPKAKDENDDGLLEFLEDIIGTSKYKAPIEASAEKMEQLNENCAEKSTWVKHVEKEKNALEDKKNKALEYLQNENELNMRKTALYQLEIAAREDTLQVAEERKAQIDAQLDEESQKNQGAEEEIKQLEQAHARGVKEFDRFQKQVKDVLAEKERLAKETVKFEEKKKFLETKRKKLMKTQESSRTGSSSAQTQVSQYTDDIERYASEITELEQEMEHEQRKLDAIRAELAPKTQKLSDEIAAKQKSLGPWHAKINERESAIAVRRSELEILIEKENSGAKNIEEIRAKIAGFQEAKAQKEQEFEATRKEGRAVQRAIEAAEKQLQELLAQEPALKSKAASARAKADEARASLSATQTQGNVLTSLMRMKESGRISGFHGRLGNLGTIDQRFDVAISTACPSLDNMVVDTVEVGQQCIEHLRKNNVGRANFILLDRLPQRDLSPIQTPENAPRLFDLVKPKDKRFLPAFYSVLQNTLVAKDLAQANRIAYGAQRWRVVTLDGQLIDKSGTMSGGGTRVARGGMSSKLAADVSKDQVVKLEQARDTLEHDLEQLQQTQRELETQLRDYRNQIPQLETKVQKLELEGQSFNRNITDCERRIQEIEAEQTTSKTDKARMKTLEKEIAGLEREVAQLRAETAGVEEEIEALKDKIMQIGGVQLRTQKAKVDGLKQQIDSRTETLSSAEVSRSKEEKQVAKHTKEYNKASEELEKLAVDDEKVDADLQAHKANSAHIMQRADEIDEEREEREEKLQELKKELDEKTSERNSTRGREIELRNKLEETVKEIEGQSRAIHSLTEKISKLKYTDLSGYMDAPRPPKQQQEDGKEEQDEMEQDQEHAGLPIYTRDELQDMDKNELARDIEKLSAKIENATIDISVLPEYLARTADLRTRTAALDDALALRDAEKAHHAQLCTIRHTSFMEGFRIISDRLKMMYQLITMGGNAELECVDSLDPFAEGISFSVMPPKKSWKNISNLSGGEKTLSSLALVFALHHYRPTPLYVMDEIDAALDFRNVSIVANYIKEATQNAQFIVISLRNNMFEQAARLVGVYKVNQMVSPPPSRHFPSLPSLAPFLFSDSLPTWKTIC